MTETELNKKYIKNKIEKCVSTNELLTVINDLCSEHYKNGLLQGKFDREMEGFMDGEILSIDTTTKLASREKAIKYIKKELKDMPDNGCSMRLKKILRVLEGNK